MAVGGWMQIHAFSLPEHQAPAENVGAPTFKVLL